MKEIVRPDIEKTYHKLIKDCSEIHLTAKTKNEEFIMSRWLIGKRILDENIPHEYGNSVIAILSQKIGFGEDTIRFCIRFADTFKTKEKFLKWFKEQLKLREEISWNYVRYEVLPPTNASYGGVKRRANSVMHYVEKLARSTEEVIEFIRNPEIDEQTKNELQGVLLKTSEVLSEFTQTIGTLVPCPTCRTDCRVVENKGRISYRSITDAELKNQVSKLSQSLNVFVELSKEVIKIIEDKKPLEEQDAIFSYGNKKITFQDFKRAKEVLNFGTEK